ncbi:LuxR C-terminal-related transcriptional regulator [Nocardia spumae]|uniref:LuxR C-terminal-related transcriptional regulator n=1 Tax=Nocardia spumae TaxID=2887190 RepID=UPI001D15DC19|nr:LuxR C-terminal-related transcriptional regulator [Nocardia spumae]
MPKLSFTPLPLAEAQARIDEAMAGGGRTVLICAPAGTGKTVLTADWVARRSGCRIGWLTFTGRRGESADLWHAIAGSVGLSDDDVNGPDLTSPLAEPALLVDRLAELPGRTVLVLDDAHLLTDPLALAGLDYLVTNAPAGLTIIVTGRFDPPMRWHVLELSGRLIRLSARELALDEVLIARLLDQHGLDPDGDEIATIQQLTCGWAALVRIAAIYLAADPQDRPTALATLACAPHAISDFLVGELLTALSEDALHFLLTTAIPEEFTVDLATELAGDSAAATLENLLRNNLPIKCVARNGELWHSYHPMLRAYLLAEAARSVPDRMQPIHRTCSTWFIDTRMPSAALHHVLAEPGRPQLSRFLREHGPRLVFGGDGPAFFARLDDIGELADDQFVQQLRIAEAVGRADIAAATAYLDRLLAEPYSASALVPTSWLTILREAVTADVAVATGNRPAAPNLTTLTPTGHPELDCYIVLQLSNAYLHRGDIAPGESGLWHALALAERAGLGRFVVEAATRLALCGGFDGHLTVMCERAEYAVELGGKYGLRTDPAITHARAMIAYVRYLQGAALDPHAAQLPTSVRSSPVPVGDRHAHAVFRLLEFDSTADRFPIADALRLQLLEILADRTPSAQSGDLILHAVLALLRIQSRVSAQTLVERAVAVLGHTPDVVVAEAALSEYAHTSSTTLELLRPLLNRCEELRPVPAVAAWLLYASACDHLDRPVKAYEALSNALGRAAGDRIVRPFVDVPGIVALLDGSVGRFGHHDRLVEQIRSHPLARTAAHSPRLTETEISVLRQLPSGMTTLNIAEGMGVSINTVKTHLRGIYHKLGSGSRAAAIARARELGLI